MFPTRVQRTPRFAFGKAYLKDGRAGREGARAGQEQGNEGRFGPIFGGYKKKQKKALTPLPGATILCAEVIGHDSRSH
jgi:hypothetical protein